MTFIVVAGLFGLLLGSFLNVVVYRLPRMNASGIVSRGKSALFLAWPGSHCPHCKAPIAPYYNLPVVGFLWLRGRAKCCGKPIGVCYPLIEAGCGLLVAAAAWRFGGGVDFALAVIFLAMLLVISVIDMRRYYILDVLTLPLLWCGLLANIDARFALLPHAVVGAAGGYIAMRLIAAAGAVVFRKNVMGGGDFKLMAAFGAWLGWQPLPFLLFLGSLIGVGYALVFYLTRRAGRTPPPGGFLKRRFSFGPALSVAAALMLFWGDEIMAAYWRFILL